MICILKTDKHDCGRWFFATDMLDARRQAEANDEPELRGAALESLDLDLPRSAYELPTGHLLFIE